MNTLTVQHIFSEIEFTTSKSSGAGGQNVNKVNSKVTLRWNIKESKLISIEQKELLINKLSNQLTTSGELIIASQEYRSQLQNRDAVLEKLNKVLTIAFKKRKVRKVSEPSKAAKQKRLESKRKHSEKKKLRKRL